MENNCKFYSLDCKCEEMGCEGCAYYKKTEEEEKAEDEVGE